MRRERSNLRAPTAAAAEHRELFEQATAWKESGNGEYRDGRLTQAGPPNQAANPPAQRAAGLRERVPVGLVCPGGRAATPRYHGSGKPENKKKERVKFSHAT